MFLVGRGFSQFHYKNKCFVYDDYVLSGEKMAFSIKK